MASPVQMKTLLEAGVHFGHQTRRWDPKMRPFIFTERNGIHIIDLQQTAGFRFVAGGRFCRVSCQLAIMAVKDEIRPWKEVGDGVSALSVACDDQATRAYQAGYQRFHYHTCEGGLNERTGTLFNRRHYPPRGRLCRGLCRIRDKQSLRGLVEMCLERGILFTHEAVREWEAKLAPVLSETLRKHRRGRVGRSWYCDETYLKVRGRWVYLYRGIDRDGNLVDVYLSERRDRAAAEAGRRGRLRRGWLP